MKSRRPKIRPRTAGPLGGEGFFFAETFLFRFFFSLKLFFSIFFFAETFFFVFFFVSFFFFSRNTFFFRFVSSVGIEFLTPNVRNCLILCPWAHRRNRGGSEIFAKWLPTMRPFTFFANSAHYEPFWPNFLRKSTV